MNRPVAAEPVITVGGRRLTSREGEGAASVCVVLVLVWRWPEPALLSSVSIVEFSFYLALLLSPAPFTGGAIAGCIGSRRAPTDRAPKIRASSGDKQAT
jgi:hypothetical protein